VDGTQRLELYWGGVIWIKYSVDVLVHCEQNGTDDGTAPSVIRPARRLSIGLITIKSQVWCKIRITKGDDLLIGVCYHSPNIAFSDKENDDMLCDLLNEVRGKPLLLMGDFNYPDIDWHTSHGQSPASKKPVNSIEDGFMTQHVMEGTCNGAILDLVITSETDMVDSVSVLNSLGNSDRNMLKWDIYPNPAVMPLFSRPSLDYARADFETMRAT